MKRRTFLRNGAMAAAGFALGPKIMAGSQGVPWKEGGELRVLELEGSPRQRGQIHGEALRARIADVIELFKAGIDKDRGVDPGTYINEFLENTRFVPAITKWTPDLLEEVKGLSEGAGIDYETMLACQLQDEEWWYGRNRELGISLTDGDHCSALGVYGQEGLPTLLGQNMDIMGWTDGYEVLLHIKHPSSSLESYVFSFAGLIALNGVNSRAIGICCNTLLQLDQRPDGLPVAFIVRGVLERQSYDAAVRFIHDIQHASGQNYTIGGPDKVAAFECSAHKVAEFVPHEGATRVYHTNHPLVNDDQGIYKAIVEKLPQEKKPKSPGNSEIRFQSLEKRLEDGSKPITVDTIKSILSSHDDPKNPVCRHPREDGGLTAGCMIYELSAQPVLHLAPGPPCSTEFKTYRFSHT